MDTPEGQFQNHFKIITTEGAVPKMSPLECSGWMEIIKDPQRPLSAAAPRSR